ncbi:DUF692 domain-containing protein [uncultured Microbulbifer sp.]|uniref:MNIO family bufferin maturase n=1 Tax=uncultured Microbulbifer sp. TaxID=348147 RepID=UPI002632659A|nr:DUF692 domain-containing protein [uncultured Microbulbifer sp.]
MSTLIQGAGVGLRTPHLSHLLNERPDVPWLELLADNWFAEGGTDLELLEVITELYPVTLHGVNLSLGTLDPLDFDYLEKIKKLTQRTHTAWYSEHCSFSSFEGKRTPDLLPLPYTHEALRHICDRIDQVQTFLGEKLLIENISCYVECADNQMSEATFIGEVARQAGCEILLDINNLYVNSVNHRFDPIDYLNELPLSSVKQLHLSGHNDKGLFLLDSHGSEIIPAVWELYEYLISKTGDIPTLIEWDHDIPSWETLMMECRTAQHILNRANTTAGIKDIA